MSFPAMRRPGSEGDMMMYDGGFSFWHWSFLVVYAVLIIVPFWRIFPRAGWPSALSLLMIVPLLNLLLLWGLAFKRWPGETHKS